MKNEDDGFSSIKRYLTETSVTIMKWLKMRSRYDLLTVAAILTYAIVFSWYTVRKSYGFGTFAWDLGIFNQAFHTTLFDGKLFYYTCELYLNPTGTYFASKFSPILFLVLPFYAISPSPETLLVFKSFVLSLGALPLYMLSTKIVGSKKAGFIFAVAYLLSPGLQSANTFDFQQQIFIPITLFSMYFFMTENQWKFYFLFVFLSFMIEEHVAIIVFLMALVQLLTKNRLKSLVQLIKMRASKPSLKASVLVITMALSVSWYFISRLVREAYPIAAEFVGVYRAADTYRVLGFTNDILSMPAYILMNPQRTFEALSYDFALKFMYLVFLFAPLLFLSLRSRLSFVSAILLAPFLLSNYPPYYTLGAHYPLYLLPLVFLAAIEGLRGHVFAPRNTEYTRHKYDVTRRQLYKTPTLTTIIVVTLIIIVSVSPLSPLSQAFTKSNSFLRYSQPYASGNFVDTLHEMINLVPQNASVLTQNNIFPHFSDRENAFVLPTIQASSTAEISSLTSYVKQEVNLSDFVLLDSVGLGTENWTSLALHEVQQREDFSVYAIGGSAILFKKSYNGSSFFVPNENFEVFLGQSDFMTTNAQIVYDPTSNDGNVVFSQKGTDPGFFVYGPYVFLPAGEFEITFEIKLGEHSEGYLGTIDVSENFGDSILGRRDIYGFEKTENAWTNYTLSLSSTELRKQVEFRVSTNGAADIYLDRVIVKRLTDKAKINFGTKTFSRQDLLLGSCTLNEYGFIIYNHNSSNPTLWYGPYTNLPSGNYTVTFLLRISWPSPFLEKTLTTRMLTIDVAKSYGQIRLVAKDILLLNLLNLPNATGWHSFTLEFMTSSSITSVEFRGLEPSSNVDISLGLIIVEKQS